MNPVIDDMPDFKMMGIPMGNKRFNVERKGKRVKINPAETGARFIHPFEDPLVIAGQATAALEMLEEQPGLDLIVCPVGGGGVLAGTALVAAARERPPELLGAEPEAVDDSYHSLRDGERYPGVEAPQTLADGLLTDIGALPFANLRAAGVRVVTVGKDAIRAAAVFHLQRMKTLVEPSGATGLAVLRKLDPNLRLLLPGLRCGARSSVCQNTPPHIATLHPDAAGRRVCPLSSWRTAADASPMESNSPYRGLPDSAVWSRTVGRRPLDSVVPFNVEVRPIDPDTLIASGGSCFAQRIAGRLGELGLVPLVTEPGPGFLAEADRRRLNYGTYAARYGNIYTALQLLQLLQRSLGEFEPQADLWRRGPDQVVDPFRPGVQTPGFVSVAECLADRATHLDAVREMFATAEVFVFTLGLTEAWVDTRDGAVLPICPGSGQGGTFDPEIYEFRNFGPAEVQAQIEEFLALVSTINPGLRLILSVSPVPLVATCSGQHVLSATTWSKAVLRVACEELQRSHQQVDYFPSYDLVLAFGLDAAFAADRRQVRPEIVEQVIRCFALQFGLPCPPEQVAEPQSEVIIPRHGDGVVCDEDEVLRALLQERTSP